MLLLSSDIQFTNATVLAGICVFPPMQHWRRDHCHHRHRNNMMSAFAMDNENDDDDDNEIFRGLGHHHHHHHHDSPLREFYLKGWMTYFNMRLGADGKFNRIFMMPLVPSLPGYRGFHTHAARTPSDTRNSNVVIDRNSRFSVMDASVGATDDEATDALDTNDTAGNSGIASHTEIATTTTGTAGPSSSAVAPAQRESAARRMLRALSAWLGVPEMIPDAEDVRLVVTLVAEGDEALLAAEATPIKTGRVRALVTGEEDEEEGEDEDEEEEEGDANDEGEEEENEEGEE